MASYKVEICGVNTARLPILTNEEKDALFIQIRQGDAEVIAIGSFALRCQCVTLPLVGWVIMNNMMFQTCGYTSPASLLAAARQGLFFIPAVMLLPLPLGLSMSTFPP